MDPILAAGMTVQSNQQSRGMSNYSPGPGSDNETGTDSDISELLARRAAAERQLLKQERKAERRLEDARKQLAKDNHRLQRAQARLERSQQAVADAEGALRACQARRAAGPPRSTE